MKIKSPIEDLVKTILIPNFKFYREDLAKFDQRMRLYIKSDDNIIELDQTEEQWTILEFKIKSEGVYNEISWKREYDNIDEFLSSKLIGNRITQGELVWDYYMGVIKNKPDSTYKEEPSKYKAILHRNITFNFSDKLCKLRISGDNPDWISETIAQINEFIGK